MKVKEVYFDGAKGVARAPLHLMCVNLAICNDYKFTIADFWDFPGLRDEQIDGCASLVFIRIQVLHFEGDP